MLYNSKICLVSVIKFHFACNIVKVITLKQTLTKKNANKFSLLI